LKLEGIETIESVDELLGKEFVINSDQLIQPTGDAYYPFQIMGLDVYTEDDQYLGKLTEVYINPNQSIYEIKSESKEYLVPATKTFIKKIDLIKKRIIIHVIEGMLDS